MSLPIPSHFRGAIYSVADGTRPAAAWGTSVTPGENVMGTAVELVASNHASWSTLHGYGIWVNINSNSTNATARDTLVSIIYRRAVASVDASADTLTFASRHGIQTADRLQLTTTGTLPGNLSLATNYYAIRQSKTVIKVATSAANARAGTAVNLSDAGTGTHTVHCRKIDYLGATSAGAFIASNGASGGFNYFFPLFVPNGTAIDIEAQVNNATVGTLRAACAIFLNPSKPYALPCGTFVRTFGATLASSSGVAITAGTSSEGSFTELGTTEDALWFWQGSVNWNSGNTNACIYHLDLGWGAAAADTTISGYLSFTTDTVEVGSKCCANGITGLVPSGNKIYARAQVGPNAAAASLSALAYGVGGSVEEDTSYTVSGTITIDGVAAANGKTVRIFAFDSDNVSELVATTTISGGAGGFSASVPDNTRSYLATYHNDGKVGATQLGTPS